MIHSDLLAISKSLFKSLFIPKTRAILPFNQSLYMSIPEEIDYKSYEEDLNILIKTLKDSFESTECEYI